METLIKLVASWNSYTLLFWISIIFFVLAVVTRERIGDTEASTGKPEWAMLLGIVFLLASVSIYAYQNNSRFRNWVSRVLDSEQSMSVSPTSTSEISSSRIAFSSDRSGTSGIYIMKVNGSEQTPINYPMKRDYNPAWSPDGTKIAFVSFRDDLRPANERVGEIYVMNADGSDITRLTRNTADDSSPSWSPDGRRIAFYTNRDGNDEIYVMNADGSQQKRLTYDPGYDRDPSWSPDGRRIAFYTNRDGNDEIYVMNADGSQETQLTNNLVDDYIPIWSPDGTLIAFTSGRNDEAEIFVMNIDGSARIQLTNNTVRDWFPTWSPDSTRIAFSSAPAGRNHEIRVLNADGSGISHNLTNNPADDWYPTWTR